MWIAPFFLPAVQYSTGILCTVWILYAGAVGVSIGSWAHDKARALLDLGDLADIDTDAT